MDRVVQYSKTHRIRKSRHHTVSGKSNALHYLSEQYGTAAYLLLSVPQHKLDNAKNNLAEKGEDTESFESFQYLTDMCGYSKPTNWREGLEL